jgi:hypothetical protein
MYKGRKFVVAWAFCLIGIALFGALFLLVQAPPSTLKGLLGAWLFFVLSVSLVLSSVGCIWLMIEGPEFSSRQRSVFVIIILLDLLMIFLTIQIFGRGIEPPRAFDDLWRRVVPGRILEGITTHCTEFCAIHWAEYATACKGM